MDDGLAGAIQTLARLTGTARGGGLTQKAALASLTTARRLAAELERGELALIEAARGGGATWYQIAAAMGASRRQTAQKTPRRPVAPQPASTESGRAGAGHGSRGRAQRPRQRDRRRRHACSWTVPARGRRPAPPGVPEDHCRGHRREPL
jgi:hypothetical protein